MKTKLSDMTEHLFEMAERLLDDELCHDKESTEKEIEKAQALSSISEQVVKIKEIQVREFDSQIHAMDVASRAGFVYKPEVLGIQNQIPKKGITSEGLPYEE